MILENIIELVGDIPAGLEPVVYVIACIVLVWILSTFFSVLWSFFTLLFGGRH